MHGIINVIKPAGMTSQQCVNIVKHKVNANKAGHLGTLDPSGSGVLPICINKATRLFDYYLGKDKVYRAVFVFGKETDTLDSDGNVVKESGFVPSLQDINNILDKFVGKLEQIPPNYSRKCVNGVRAYELARNNENFVLAPKLIEIYNLKCLNQISDNSFLFEIHCSSGTYIRSLVRDIAYALNTVGYMGAIIRLKSGNFSIENAVCLEQVDNNCIVDVENVLCDLEKYFLDEKFYNKLINGVVINVNEDDNKENVLLYCKNEMFGIANICNGKIKIKTNLR